MRLLSAEIEGFRSINEPIKLFCDRKITIVLAANDHGKTNVLEALRHLNVDYPFDQEHDLNWDREATSEMLPRVRWDFSLDETEQAAIQDLLNRKAYVQGADRNYKSAREAFTVASSELGKLLAEKKELEARLKAPAEQQENVAESAQAASKDVKAAAEPLKARLNEVTEIYNKLRLARDTKMQHLLLAIADDLDSNYLLKHGPVDDGVTKAILEAARDLEGAVQKQKEADARLGVARANLEQAKGAGDANAIKTAEVACTRFG